MSLICTCRRFTIHEFLRRSTLNTLKFHAVNSKPQSKCLLGKIPIVNKPQNRTYFWFFKRRTNREVRLVDNPPEDYELIYRYTFDNMMLSFQHLSLYTAVILGVSYLLKGRQIGVPAEGAKNKNTEKYEKNALGNVMLIAEDSDSIVFLTGYILLFCIFHVIMMRMPVRIYSHPTHKKYLMCFYGSMPNQLKKVPIKAGKLIRKPGTFNLLFKNDMYENKETMEKYILYEHHFKWPADLYILLGEQEYPDVFDKFSDKYEQK
ncbi:uncharacterized protein [Euwallacea fornicatus]|uniref:uncharacterized protein n=1 Tax=Euwallacea fornicatus TaxID=995702 RepID=UPI00339045E0